MQEGANYVPSLREYTARWGVTPERLRPGQKVMHPGPMNRGVEIDPRVADAGDALIETQVRAGLVVRMAVLYDLLTTGPVGGQGRAPDGGGVMRCSSSRTHRRRTSSIRGARVLDPAEGIDTQVDVQIDGGTIAELGSSLPDNGHRVLDGAGLVLAPAFVDPHVHLRTPGREDEETIASGTAGGRGGRLLRDPRDAEHRAGRRLGRGARRAGRAGAGRGRGPGRLPRRDLEGPGRHRADRDGRARRRRRGRLHRRRPAGRRTGADAARAPVRADHRPAARAPLRGADALPRRAHARGRRSRPSSASAATRRSPRA